MNFTEKYHWFCFSFGTGEKEKIDNEICIVSAVCILTVT